VPDWNALAKPAHAERLALVRSLLDVRKRSIVPLLPEIKSRGEASFASGLLRARWRAGAKSLQLLANLSDKNARRPGACGGEPIWGGEPPLTLSSWSVYAAIGAA
jgi:1,4-alpha-glucan branching enzyme/maltooligosyltrehalose trehalohydrolase